MAALTETEIKDYILDILGMPTVQVELDRGRHVERAIDRAIRLFRRHFSLTRTVTKTGVDGTVLYASPTDFPTNAQGITRFDTVSTEQAEGTNLNVFTLTERRWRVGRFPGELAELRAMHESQQRQVGAEPTYEFDLNSGAPRLLVHVNGPVDVSFDVALPIETLADIPYAHEQLFLDAVEAYSRKMLGDIRGKFGGRILGPSGELEMDASEQRRIGEEMERVTVEELKKLQKAVPPILGF